MTVFELHLSIDQKLQEQGSYQHDRIFPEAKDIALNEAQDEILEQIIDDNVTESKVRLTHARPLLERNLAIPLTASDLESHVVSGRIPPYIYTFLNLRAQVYTHKTCGSLPNYTQAKPFVYAELPFPESQETAGPYYLSLEIVNNADTVIYSLPASLSGRFLSKDQKYEIINDIIDTLNIRTSTRNVQWENGNFLIWSTAGDTSFTLRYNKTGDVLDQTVTVAVTNPAELTFNNISYAGDTNLSGNACPVRWVKNEDLYIKKLNKFTGPKVNEPFFITGQHFLWVNYHKDSIVTNVYADYIRKPKKISLILNRTSELDPSVHPQIVDRAVEILKQNIQDQSIQGDVQYNQITTRK